MMNEIEQQEEMKKQHRLRSVINFCQGVALTLLIFAGFVAIYLLILYQTRLAPFTNYAIVFDAGSSHTEMFVYHWPADKSNGLGTTSSVNELFVCPLLGISTADPTKQGSMVKLKAISDFEQHLHLLDDYFRPCLQRALDQIPSSRYKFSPIFLGATAGMRLARLKNETRAKQVLESIREIFSNHPFQFVTARQVRILTGMEEAVDGWITTNILQEKIQHRHPPKRSVTSDDDLDPNMVGVLDLGGASTQVTFTYTTTSDDEPIPPEFTTNITLFDTIYHPYAHSYLCWGKNEALRRHRARLLNAAININRTHTPVAARLLIRDPCFARGANETIPVAQLFASPCTANEKQQFNNNINVSSFTFVGTGNASQCEQRLMNLFDAKRNDKTVNCTYKQQYCTFDHTFQPTLPSKLNFIGLSGYYYVFHNLAHRMNKTSGSTERYDMKDFSKEELSQRLVNVCETPYQTLYQQEAMTAANEQHKRGLCFDAWYMWLLLTHAIGFKQNDLKRLSFANTFPTGKVGWTLGYMINQTNYIPAEYRARPIEKHRFISWFTVSVLIVLITLLFLIITCQRYVRHMCSKRTHHIVRNQKDGYVRPIEQSTA